MLGVLVPPAGALTAAGADVSSARGASGPGAAEEPERLSPSCIDCARCVAACPTAALMPKRGFVRERCLQHWSSIPGALPAPVEAAWGDRLYGCDACQEACPLLQARRLGDGASGTARSRPARRVARLRAGARDPIGPARNRPRQEMDRDRCAPQERRHGPPMQMKSRFYTGGIFRRQFVALFGTAVVFFGVASLVIILGTSGAVIARELELTVAYRDELRSRIGDWLSERMDDIQFFARSLYSEGADALKPSTAASRLSLFASVETVFSNALIAAPDGAVVATKSGLPKEPSGVADRDYFQAASSGKSVVSGFLRGRKSGTAELALAAPLRPGARGSPVVVGFLGLENLTALVQEVSLGAQGNAYLVDGEGRVITPAFLKRFKELGPAAAGVPLGNYAVAQLRAGLEGSGQYLGYDGSRVLGAFTHIEPIGLGLVVELSRARALSPISSLLASGLVFFLVMIAAIVVVAAWLSLRLVAPIRSLIAAAQGVIGGEDFAPLDISTGTEIDRLAEFFNRMVAAVREREQGLRDSAARDSLTGLYNHARIEEFLDLEIKRKRRSGERVAFVMLDIDHLKGANDESMGTSPAIGSCGASRAYSRIWSEAET